MVEWWWNGGRMVESLKWIEVGKGGCDGMDLSWEKGGDGMDRVDG
jgi:hypothetical protein